MVMVSKTGGDELNIAASTQQNTSAGSNNGFSIAEVLASFVSHWYWFIISLAICLGAAWYYLATTSPVYTRSAMLLIKDDSKGSSVSNIASEMQDIGLVANKSNLSNELISLKSPTLMTQVVKELQLMDYYKIPVDLREQDIYGKSPIKVVFDASKKENTDFVSFKIKLFDDNYAELYDFNNKGIEIKKSVNVNLNDSVSAETPVGHLSIYLTGEESGDVYKNINFYRTSVDAATNTYTGTLSVGLVDKQSTVVNLSITDESIARATDVIKTVINVYNDNWVHDKNRIAESTSEFISSRLGVIESELTGIDKNIANFKGKNLLPDIAAVSQLYLQQNSATKDRLLELNNQLSMLEYIQDILREQNFDNPLPISSSMSRGNLQSQIAEYNKILLERNRMLANSSENHPLVKDQTKHLNAMQSVILQSVNNEIASLSMQIKNVNAQESRTERQLARNPNQAKYLLSEERQQKVMEGLYLFLLQKREENALSQAFTAYNTRLITEPRGSNMPAAPNRSMIWVLAVIAGLLIPAAVMTLIEMSNTTIRGRQDVERLTVPFAGEIPQCTKKEGNTENGITLVVKESCRNIINEAFRVVRTNVDFMLGKGKAHKVVMFTSLNPGSGKSFVSANLAYCMSLKKKKVVAVDLDLRRASLSQVVDRPHHGVVDYLNGDKKSWRDVLVHIEDSTFDVIPVGEIPPNPTELLFNDDYLPRMIDELKQEYDYVFIDCPPVDVVADANVVSEYVDMALFVVRAGLMKKDMLPIVDTFYNQKKFPSLSLILNGTSVTKTMGTKYGYGYGYGYGNYIKE